LPSVKRFFFASAEPLGEGKNELPVPAMVNSGKIVNFVRREACKRGKAVKALCVRVCSLLYKKNLEESNADTIAPNLHQDIFLAASENYDSFAFHRKRYAKDRQALVGVQLDG